MKIDFLYIEGCPHSLSCLETLQVSLNKFAITEPITMIMINNNTEAVKHTFIGSPTIRIDGEDADPTNSSKRYGTSCRMYWHKDALSGTPSVELIETLINKHK